MWVLWESPKISKDSPTSMLHFGKFSPDMYTQLSKYWVPLVGIAILSWTSSMCITSLSSLDILCFIEILDYKKHCNVSILWVVHCKTWLVKPNSSIIGRLLESMNVEWMRLDFISQCRTVDFKIGNLWFITKFSKFKWWQLFAFFNHMIFVFVSQICACWWCQQLLLCMYVHFSNIFSQTWHQLFL